MLLIGSKALRFNGVPVTRVSYDHDFIGTKDEVFNFIKTDLAGHVNDIKISKDGTHVYAFTGNAGTLVYEFELAWEGSSGEKLLQMVKDDPSLLAEKSSEYTYDVAGLEVLRALKESHKYKKNSPHFRKTMDDVLALRARVKLSKKMREWLKVREAETYNYNHPKLNGVGKGEFFSDDGINYVYDHDAIHLAVKHLEKPAYSYFQPDGEAVGTSKEMFKALPKSIRLLSVLEEAYVLSLERSIIPFNSFGNEALCKRAFEIALEKVCTSITSGWWRQFAWDNYHTVLGMYDQEYVTRFEKAVEAGEVPPHGHDNEHM